MGTDERSWFESLKMMFEKYPHVPLLCTASDLLAAKEDAKFLGVSISV
jgi:hypothetical protein